jgi:hypothetical protein
MEKPKVLNAKELRTIMPRLSVGSCADKPTRSSFRALFNRSALSTARRLLRDD